MGFEIDPVVSARRLPRKEKLLISSISVMTVEEQKEKTPRKTTRLVYSTGMKAQAGSTYQLGARLIEMMSRKKPQPWRHICPISSFSALWRIDNRDRSYPTK